MIGPDVSSGPFQAVKRSFNLARQCGTTVTQHVTILSMLTEQIVALLIAERERLNGAIEALQGPTQRREKLARNPRAVAAQAAGPEPPNAIPAPAKRKRRKFTPAQRRAFGERMKAYWAAKRKVASKGKALPAKKKAKAA